MRGLQFEDVFTVIKLLNKLNLDAKMIKGLVGTFDPKSVDVEGLTPAQAKKKIAEVKEMTANEKGLEVLFTILQNSGEAEEEIYKFVASLNEYNDPDRARTMSFEELGLFIKEFREIKGLRGFFTQVFKFMK